MINKLTHCQEVIRNGLGGRLGLGSGDVIHRLLNPELDIRLDKLILSG